jgi:hypothetical protein
MIISFFDKNFKGLQNNASLVVDNKSYSLIKRGVELDELKCTCEPFTENIQPTFLIVRNDRGRYVYGSLAGIPELTNERKTNVVGTDLKSMLKSDVILSFGTLTTVKDMFDYVFGEWDTQVNQGGFDCELEYKQYTVEGITSGAADIPLTELKHQENGKYDAWSDIFSPYLKYYGLYMTSRIDLINKKVIFTIGKSMLNDLNIKLWEQGIYDYGKKIADVNECQGYVLLKGENEVYTAGYKWILTSQNAITTNASLRDIFPVKRRLIIKETEDGTKVSELLNEANREALELLCESLYKENITLSVNGDFETKFNIYVKRGGGLYKSLPCGELHYDANGLKQLQIGYRFTGLQFLL